MLSVSSCAEENRNHIQNNRAHKIHVLSTIKPIAIIVAAIAGEAGRYVEQEQLIPDYASPHFFTLKPSSIRKLKQADLIFRIGDNMEIMLAPVFDRLDDKSRLVSLAQQAKIHLLPLPAGHMHHHPGHTAHDADDDEHNVVEDNVEHEDEHDHSHEHEDHEAQHEHETFDPHIWTSPENAFAMAQLIADKLADKDPQHAAVYRHNLKLFGDKLKTVGQTVREKLSAYRNKPYIVFHPNWQYFAHDFKLQKPVIVNFQEAITPGIKTILRIRREIASKQIHCIFSDPEVQPQMINILKENLHDIKAVQIDVLARHLAIKQNSYAIWLQDMSQKITQCFK